MTGTVAYILARKIALGAVSGIKNLSFSGNQIIFNFNDGSQATMTVPLPKDGIDGVSVIDVKIDANNHLICTMSDSSTIDAGELPGGTGRGLIQVKNKAALPKSGTDDTLYLTQDDDILYYWNDKDKLYKPITGGGANGIDFNTSSDIEFDGIETTFDLPIDDKKISIYINGMYLTDGEDYTIDRTVSPNQVTFEEVWEETDLCTVVWVKGNITEGEYDLSDYYTKQEVNELIAEAATKELITIKDTSVMNISQLPVDKLPCCLHMVGSRIMGTYFNDDIIYVSRVIDNKFSVHTMDGVIMKVFYNQEEGTLRLDDYLNLVDDVTLSNKLSEYYKSSQIDVLIPNVIKRCVWFYAAGDDISLFAQGNTNVASFTEFIGHKPTISSNNVGIILVDNKLYWTKFNITALNENSGAAYQEFTQDPILIGPIEGNGLTSIATKDDIDELFSEEVESSGD